MSYIIDRCRVYVGVLYGIRDVCSRIKDAPDQQMKISPSPTCFTLAFYSLSNYVEWQDEVKNIQHNSFSLDLERRCPKLAIVKYLGIFFFNILRLQPSTFICSICLK